MAEKKSWLMTHPHIRRYVNYGLIFVAGVSVFLMVFFTLGKDVVINWTQGVAHSVGFHIESHDELWAPPPE